ncbi:MAG: phage major capsid protein [Mesorhizobium sp.]|uniref:phage major capsid protein n=1 Tax=unclassified Mesorhizobium TaxID=325217 RepID=UPI000FCB349D|nr:MULTISPECIES: phage major capsid protein [unclassified Mesorhizobium]RUV67011.1 phage major capsid protein [Mesorhizobium sp. M5C.F.Cr.IN.023.01.1.1]RWI51055.1 MAG: phage major capsid protein [Mesorhizobium sp.]RWI62043.1 MAG: phage major capsid protein [Mesorhizobium sp.]RWJ13893.1 MAG: phage major capsid protein [Mesorhizobium sp.]RWJ16881.1 MAG: phage major capsid protein [Mesorhizobium sp.]
MPELKDVLEDVQREVKKFGDDVGTLKTSMEKDLKAVRELAEKAGTDAAAGTQLKKDLENLSRGVEEKHAAIEAKVKEMMEKAQKEADAILAIEKKLGRPGVGGGEQETVLKHATEFKRVAMSRRGELKLSTILKPEDVNVDEYKAYQDAFKMSLRREMNQLSQDEQKAMMVGSDPDGGFLVPTQTSSRIVTKVWETSPIDELAYHETVTGDALLIAIDTDEAGAGWVGETEARPETSTPQVGEQRIPVFEIYAKPKASQQLLEDAGIDVEAWLERKVSEKFARMRALAFISGNGIKKPRGILTYPAGSAGVRGTIAQIPSGHATLLTDNGLVTMTFSLKDKYLANATWLMKRGTLGAVMLFKDLNGQYMWRPGLEAGKPSMLLGYNVRRADDMPTVGAGTLPVAFGDFRAGYTVVDRLGIRTLRDQYSSKPFVEFYTRQRVGGDVVDFEAYALQVVGT